MGGPRNPFPYENMPYGSKGDGVGTDWQSMYNDRRPKPPAKKATKAAEPPEKITPRMSQDAMSHVGDEIAMKILGAGGLSGASESAHRKLIKKARQAGWKG